LRFIGVLGLISGDFMGILGYDLGGFGSVFSRLILMGSRNYWFESQLLYARMMVLL
jgi:hypothetical protein